MSTPSVESQAFSYEALDDLAVQASAAAVALWAQAGAQGASAREVLDLLTDLVVAMMVQAEELGRLYGLSALPVDGAPVMPTFTAPRRPAPEDFEQRSALAPPPSPDLRDREAELRERVGRALSTITARAEPEAPAPEVPAPSADVSAALERMVGDEIVSQAQRGFQDGVRVQVPPASERGSQGPSRDDEGVPRGFEAPMPKPGEVPEGLDVNREARQVPRSRSAVIRGYRRGINPGACELCFWLWKEGYVYPIDQPMSRHTGCRCVPVPTTDPVGRWKLSQDERKLLIDLYEKYQQPRNRKKGFTRQVLEDSDGERGYDWNGDGFGNADG